MLKHLVYIGIGSNQGHRKEYLEKAIKRIKESVGEIRAISPVYETPPWGFKAEQWFYNQVLAIETTLKPTIVLTTLQTIESELGRTRSIEGYSSRTIDLDILFFNSKIIKTETLTVPHPKLHKRNFVLYPMNDIAPNFRHPEFYKTINELLKSSPDKSVCRIAME